jgi:hypothetical protein
VGGYSEHGISMGWSMLEASVAGLYRRVLVEALPAHPGNAVKVIYAFAGGPDREVRGHATGINPATGAQQFAADLPVPPEGMPVTWRPVLSRSGRTLDPKLGGIAPDTILPVPPASSPVISEARETVPVHPARFPFAPQFLFRVTASFLADDTPVGETPDGLRFLFALRDGGTVRGPALNGEILHKGGDWMRVRRDGVGICAIDALIRPDSGGIVMTEYTGVCDFGPDGFAALSKGTPPRTAPLRFAPRYLTAVPALQWMNRLQCLSIGEVNLERQVIEYDLYAFGPIVGRS